MSGSQAPDQQLTAEAITVAFGGVTVLDEVEIRLERRQILGLIGPNGAGKTTLVNVLTGFQPPATGTVRIDGRDVTGEPAHRRVRRGLSRTFQGGRVFAEMSVLENVEVAALRGGFSRRKARREARELLELSGLGPRAETLAGALSFGDERRLGLARATAMRPNYLMLDEPAAGLDEQESEELRQVVADIRDVQGCGVLVIEHDMRLIMALCDEIQVLDYGRTIARDSPTAIRANPAVIAAYLGSFA